jgi:hypothetical protein
LPPFGEKALRLLRNRDNAMTLLDMQTHVLDGLKTALAFGSKGRYANQIKK